MIIILANFIPIPTIIIIMIIIIIIINIRSALFSKRKTFDK